MGYIGQIDDSIIAEADLPLTMTKPSKYPWIRWIPLPPLPLSVCRYSVVAELDTAQYSAAAFRLAQAHGEHRAGSVWL